MPITPPATSRELQQLALCQRLILQNSYISQESIRQDLQRYGYPMISQSTISRLLKTLGVIKIRNSRGQRIYSLDPLIQPLPGAGRTIAEMVVDVVHNQQFILVHTAAGYGRAVARILDCQAIPQMMGVVAGSDNVWIAPKHTRQIGPLFQQIRHLLNAG